MKLLIGHIKGIDVPCCDRKFAVRYLHT